MKPQSSWIKKGWMLAAGTLCIAFVVSAQVQTQTDTTAGPSSKQVTVERGEVVMVDGNDLIVKMDDGTIRHFPNVPESAKITVDGQQLGVHDLKPGMKLQRTITTTTTPKTITTVQTVTGKVFHVTPPLSVILTLEDGTNQQFKIPNGQKFKINGQMVDAFGLKKGMNVSATKIVEEPVTVVEHERQVTGKMPPPPPAPPADVPILVVVAVPVPAPAATEAPAKLPKTGTELPFVALIGLLCLTVSFGLRLFRRSAGM
jgi:LPXTG-motif cell wall-anchored protein